MLSGYRGMPLGLEHADKHFLLLYLLVVDLEALSIAFLGLLSPVAITVVPWSFFLWKSWVPAFRLRASHQELANVFDIWDGSKGNFERLLMGHFARVYSGQCRLVVWVWITLSQRMMLLPWRLISRCPFRTEELRIKRTSNHEAGRFFYFDSLQNSRTPVVALTNQICVHRY